jgi:CDP-paratose 2-epimerase
MIKKILITGGAGFIGINLAYSLLNNKDNFVIIYDNLSRKGSEKNIKWILSSGFKNIEFIKGDIRDYTKLKKSVKEYDCIYHLAAQVAVTKSVENPIEDFEINAQGTLYLLEAVRKNSPEAVFVFSSTNKVYGELLHLKLKEQETRYSLIGKNGIDENENLDFHSPYGNSKGTADQYIRDYYRIYGLKTVVFRQSCIFGPHQHGNTDQGWVAHFIIKTLNNEGITIYGDGKQVRDILDVSDLIRAYNLSVKNIEKVKGNIFNIGGGIDNTFSLLEFINFLEKETEKKIKYKFSDWRPGDQKIFISNNAKLKKELGWFPKISKEQGTKALIEWIKANYKDIE